MKKNIFRIAFFAAIAMLNLNCQKEALFSEDYDISLPAPVISKISEESPFVGTQIVLTGTNLNTVSTVAIGANVFKIVSQTAETITVEVPRTVEAGPLTLVNKYKRTLMTIQILKPQFYVAKVTSWPAEIQRGKPFVLKGENLDLLKEVKIAGKTVSVFGSASATKVSYASSGVELGEAAVIEITPKTGEKQTSAAIPVVAPKNTYIPKQTLNIVDFDLPYTVVGGDAVASCTYGEIAGFFGKGFEVKAAQGNGWNGIYLKIESNNGGKGFDLSTYTRPCFTMLVNTKGSFGYVQPIVTSGGSFEDKHLTGAFGYGDDYKVKTDGWEWRSYDLAALGFSAAKGNLEKFGIQFRGGNVGNGNTDAFYIAVDQIMITDGPVNPSLIWDAEVAGGGDLPISFNGGSNLTGYSQGANYATYKYTVGSDTWAWLGNLASIDNLTLDPNVYANGIYLNFLVNTGDTEGYAGFQIVQGANKLANQKLDIAYGDNYKFRPTNSKWEWRSMKFDINTWDVWGGSADKFDLSKAFTLSVYARGGNIGSGVNAQLHMDYFIFTTVPLDPNLISE